MEDRRRFDGVVVFVLLLFLLWNVFAFGANTNGFKLSMLSFSVSLSCLLSEFAVICTYFFGIMIECDPMLFLSFNWIVHSFVSLFSCINTPCIETFCCLVVTVVDLCGIAFIFLPLSVASTNACLSSVNLCNNSMGLMIRIIFDFFNMIP